MGTAMGQLYFTKEHEWIAIDGDVGTVGVTDHAQHALGDIVFVELPEIGVVLTRGGAAAVVESVKAASDVYAPVTGEVIDVNRALVDQPGQVNQSAEGEGWFFKLRLAAAGDLDGLLDRAAYEQLIAGLE
jgi:glycine cleavage system H protein